MKQSPFRLSLLVVLMLTAFIANNTTLSAQSACKAKQIAKNAKSNITRPYKYDSYAMTEFVFDKKGEKKVVVNFTAFEDMRYKIAFFNSGFEEALSVNIYDKSSAIKTRKKLYDSSQGIDNDYWVYDIVKPGKYYIEYNIPPSLTGVNKPGCIVMLIGYADVVDVNEPAKK